MTILPNWRISICWCFSVLLTATWTRICFWMLIKMYLFRVNLIQAADLEPRKDAFSSLVQLYLEISRCCNHLLFNNFCFRDSSSFLSQLSGLPISSLFPYPLLKMKRLKSTISYKNMFVCLAHFSCSDLKLIIFLPFLLSLPCVYYLLVRRLKAHKQISFLKAQVKITALTSVYNHFFKTLKLLSL